MNTSHSLPALLAALGHAGVALAQHPTEPDRLRYRPAPLEAESDARMRAHKPALLDLLTGGPRPFPDSDAAYILAERLGVADGLGMPTHPGAPAWLIAVAESQLVNTEKLDCQLAITVVAS